VQVTQPQARLLVGAVESLALRGEEAKRYWDRLRSACSRTGSKPAGHLTGCTGLKLLHTVDWGETLGAAEQPRPYKVVQKLC